MKQTITAFFVFFFSSLLFAAPTKQLYQINLVIFSHISPETLSAETWKNMLTAPNLQNTIQLNSTSAATTTTNPTAYQWLSINKNTLAQDANKLAKHGYSILVQGAWIQPLNTKATAKWIQLQGGNAYDAKGQVINLIADNSDNGFIDMLPIAKYRELNGKIRIRLNRFLFVDSQLYLTEPQSIFGGAVQQPIDNGKQPLPLVTFALKQSHRVMLDNINYIDHPVFGMLIQVRRYTLKKS